MCERSLRDAQLLWDHRSALRATSSGERESVGDWLWFRESFFLWWWGWTVTTRRLLATSFLGVFQSGCMRCINWLAPVGRALLGLGQSCTACFFLETSLICIGSLLVEVSYAFFFKAVCNQGWKPRTQTACIAGIRPCSYCLVYRPVQPQQLLPSTEGVSRWGPSNCCKTTSPHKALQGWQLHAWLIQTEAWWDFRNSWTATSLRPPGFFKASPMDNLKYRSLSPIHECTQF